MRIGDVKKKDWSARMSGIDKIAILFILYTLAI